jgi:putative transposase
MSTRNHDLATGEFYHIYNRGVDKRNIFETKADYDRFMQLLYLCNSSNAINLRDARESRLGVFGQKREDQLVSIGAYCLMPNHFHILITSNEDGGITKFMNKLSTGYVMYFNKRNERSGSLLQGAFKSKHADSDQYLKYLFSYIHLNPYKLSKPQLPEGSPRGIGTFRYLKEYEYSSLVDYFGPSREEGKILDRKAFPEYFIDNKELETELFEWIKYKEE